MLFSKPLKTFRHQAFQYLLPDHSIFLKQAFQEIPTTSQAFDQKPEQQTFRYLENNFTQVGSPISISGDESISFNLPKKLRFGISYGLIDKYRIGLDINLANWTSNEFNNTSIQNTQEFILGGEITPDSRNITSYLKRVTYRFGLNYYKLPYLVQNNSINEFGINFGASFPVAGLSTLDLAMKFGERGTIENGLINESFTQIILGLTINEKWFIKRKYN